MKLHYKGKFDGKEETLPQREHPAGALQFREPDAKKFTLIANIGALLLAAVFLMFRKKGKTPPEASEGAQA